MVKAIENIEIELEEHLKYFVLKTNCLKRSGLNNGHAMILK